MLCFGFLFSFKFLISTLNPLQNINAILSLPHEKHDSILTQIIGNVILFRCVKYVHFQIHDNNNNPCSNSIKGNNRFKNKVNDSLHDDRHMFALL